MVDSLAAGFFDSWVWSVFVVPGLLMILVELIVGKTGFVQACITKNADGRVNARNKEYRARAEENSKDGVHVVHAFEKSVCSSTGCNILTYPIFGR